MRRLHRSKGVFFGIILAALSGGCVTDAGNVLVIRQNQVPEEGCAISPSLSDLFRPEGLIDVNASGGYFFTPVIQSRATVASGQDPTQRLVTVQGAEVRLQLFDDSGEVQTFNEAPSEFSTRFGGSVEPGGTLGLGFEILQTSHLDELADQIGEERWQVLAEVVVFGQLSGGDVESEPFAYPVNVCNGCLLRNLGDCASLPVGFTTDATGGICNDLQDAVLECCEDGETLVCPAVSTMTGG